MSVRTDLATALRLSWIVVSLVLMAAVVAPFVFPSEVLYGLFPECEARARGGSCAFCGMTTAFVEIAGGDLEAARRANAGAVPLYSAFVVNFAAASTYSFTRVLRRQRRS